MLAKDHIATLVEAGKATRLGPNWPGKRCLAKTRRATLCQKPAIRGRGRCQLHDGKSTGPRTSEGKKRVSGDTSREATSDEVKSLRRETSELKEALAETLLENRLLKKSTFGDGGERG